MQPEQTPPWDTHTNAPGRALPPAIARQPAHVDDTGTGARYPCARTIRDASRLVAIGERLPPFDYGARVIVYTDGIDFAGQQYFDIAADELWETKPGARSEIAAAATHWMWGPLPGAPGLEVVETRQLDTLRAGLSGLGNGPEITALINALDRMRGVAAR